MSRLETAITVLTCVGLALTIAMYYFFVQAMVHAYETHSLFWCFIALIWAITICGVGPRKS